MATEERMDVDGPTGQSIKSVETLIEIVECLKELEGAGITEISERSELSKGTVHKHLNTLNQNDFIRKSGQTYHLGLRFLDVGGFVRLQRPGSAIIKQKVRELAEETDEIALFTTVENNRPITLYREMGEYGVPTKTRVGKRLYLHQIASGKAMLAEFSDEQIENVIETVGLPKATENTITDEEELWDEIERTRERGYAFSFEESTKGLQAVAVSVTGEDDEIHGACAVAAPLHRMNEQTFEEELPSIIRSVANEIELSIIHG